MMLRRVLMALTILCWLLCVAVAILWPRSHRIWETLSYKFVSDLDHPDNTRRVMWLDVWSNNGAFGGSIMRYQDETDYAIANIGWNYIKRKAAYLPVPDQRWIFFSTAGAAMGSTESSVHESGRECWFHIPYWMLLPVLLPLPIWHVRRTIRQRLRLKRGQCLNCGYDLRASKDKCPECGTAIPPRLGPVNGKVGGL